MSWTLGIDTSSTSLSLGLLKDGEPHLTFSRYVKNSHSEHITDVIKSFFALADITAAEVSHCVIVTGPGSFTGLRIGISFIKGLFASGETKIYPLSTLENMAASYPLQNGIINVIIDARQDNIFYAQFEKNGKSLKRVCEDKKINLEEFSSLLSDDQFTLYDPAGNKRSTICDHLTTSNSSSLEDLNLSTGLAAAIRGEQQFDSSEWEEAINIYPNYMQESYAERVKK